MDNTNIVSPPTLFFDITSDSSDYEESDYEDDDDSFEDNLPLMTPEEKEEVKYLAIFENNCEHFDEQIMSVDSVNELKKLEQAMMERTERGYYRCKIEHEEFYNECIKCYAKYCLPEMLKMLQHDYSTQKNEALNHSVASLAPKGKDYSKSSSLKTRILLTAGAQIVGHY